jgi:hypothetical protein
MSTVKGQRNNYRSLEQINNFHSAVDAITEDKAQRLAILRSAGFNVDAEMSDGVELYVFE